MFVLFDNEANVFLGKNGGFGKQHATAKDAKKYKRKSAAIEAASLHNVNRNIPIGMIANHKYLGCTTGTPASIVLVNIQSFVTKTAKRLSF